MQNTFGVKKAGPSKVESYLEVSGWTDWQQGLISECSQGSVCWTHKYYTGHIIASYCFQIWIGQANLLSLYFKRLTREHKNHNHLSFGHLFIHWQKCDQMTNT